MAARGLEFRPNTYYHLYNRGANRQPIFREARNYHFLLGRIKQYAEAFQVAVIAYCLLPNHYHLLVRQETDVKVSVFMQAVFNSYTKAFNKAYSRTGTLFESRYKAIEVKEYSYLLRLCLYIHYNPVAARLVTDPAAWPFSNYLAFIRRNTSSLCDMQFLEDNFRDPNEYERLMKEYKPSK